MQPDPVLSRGIVPGVWRMATLQSCISWDYWADQGKTMAAYWVEIIVLSGILGFSGVWFGGSDDPAIPATREIERLLFL